MNRFSVLPIEVIESEEEQPQPQAALFVSKPRSSQRRNDPIFSDESPMKLSKCKILVQLWIISKSKEKFQPAAIAASFHDELRPDLTAWKDEYRHQDQGLVMFCPEDRAPLLKATQDGIVHILEKYDAQVLYETFDWSDGKTTRPLKKIDYYEILNNLGIVDKLSFYGLRF